MFESSAKPLLHMDFIGWALLFKSVYFFPYFINYLGVHYYFLSISL